MERMISAPALQFKGSGWYVTDYGKGGKLPSANGHEKSDSKGEGKSESKSETKSETKSESKTESKPAASTPSTEK